MFCTTNFSVFDETFLYSWNCRTLDVFILYIIYINKKTNNKNNFYREHYTDMALQHYIIFNVAV